MQELLRLYNVTEQGLLSMPAGCEADHQLHVH